MPQDGILTPKYDCKASALCAWCRRTRPARSDPVRVVGQEESEGLRSGTVLIDDRRGLRDGEERVDVVDRDDLAHDLRGAREALAELLIVLARRRGRAEEDRVEHAVEERPLGRGARSGDERFELADQQLLDVLGTVDQLPAGKSDQPGETGRTSRPTDRACTRACRRAGRLGS